jgi:excisionase family DNA binding protein
MVPKDHSEIMTLDEVAAYLRVAPDAVERAIGLQGLPARKVNDEWRFLLDAVRDWLRKPDGKQALLLQAGALKDDPSFPELMKSLSRNRGKAKSPVRKRA